MGRMPLLRRIFGGWTLILALLLVWHAGPRQPAR
jgi:hypothetical protein